VLASFVEDANIFLDVQDQQGDSEEIIEQKVINEEYKIWKKNSPLLYDMMFAYV